MVPPDRFRYNAIQLLGELQVQQPPGRDVDRDRELVVGVVPLVALAQGLVEHMVDQGG